MKCRALLAVAFAIAAFPGSLHAAQLSTTAVYVTGGNSLTYPSCDVVNVSASPVTVRTILYDYQGAVLLDSKNVNLAPNNVNFLQTNNHTIPLGYVFCKFTTATPAALRASISVYYSAKDGSGNLVQVIAARVEAR